MCDIKLTDHIVIYINWQFSTHDCCVIQAPLELLQDLCCSG